MINPATVDEQSTERIPFAVPDVGDEEIAAVVDALRSGWLTTGPNAAAFEVEFARLLGDGVIALAVNSATAALHLSLEAIGIGPGDEVLVPTWTFTATAEVVRYLGARPVLVDVDASTLNIDLDAAAASVTPAVRAIVPVHFAGLPVSPSELRRFAERFDVAVVEDAAHALPAMAEGQLVGSGASEATAFSFYATKPVTTGEGGMLVTRQEDIAARARVMRLHGISRDVFDRYSSVGAQWRYDVIAPGYKYNMPDLAAAIGRVQLARAQMMRDRREAIAARYEDGLADLPLQLPEAGEAPGWSHAWHLYVVRLHPDASLSRDGVIGRLAELGVGTSVHFVPLHLLEYWRTDSGLKPEDLPVATAEFQRALSLPIYSAMADKQVDRVIGAVRETLGT